MADHRGNVERGRQIIVHGVQHQLDPLVLERGACDHRIELVGDGGASDRGLDLLDRSLDALDVFFHVGIVAFGKFLKHLAPPFLGDRLVVLRDFDVLHLLAHFILVDAGFHGDQIDDPLEF